MCKNSINISQKIIVKGLQCICIKYVDQFKEKGEIQRELAIIELVDHITDLNSFND